MFFDVGGDVFQVESGLQDFEVNDKSQHRDDQDAQRGYFIGFVRLGFEDFNEFFIEDGERNEGTNGDEFCAPEVFGMIEVVFVFFFEEFVEFPLGGLVFHRS